ncbi:MAG TPA: hypothetical protein VLF91_05155 [Candidatus Saccharimonadales bacterium]|nr:hypothetical protein [Candidatus Saccharimonadales bacterium]
MKPTNKNLSGTFWSLTYWYPSNDHSGEDATSYKMRAHHIGNELILESLPKSDGSALSARLALAGTLATGTWQEKTAPDGAFGGATYSGAGQLILDASAKHMQGQWAGIGIDRATDERRIYTGRWKLAMLKSPPSEASALDLTGVWLSRFIPKGLATSKNVASKEHYVALRLNGNELLIGGVPGFNDSSFVARLQLQGAIATGTWQEYHTPLDKQVDIRHGSAQLLIQTTNGRLSGSWLSAGEKQVETGRWEIKRVSKQALDVPMESTQ